MLNPLQNENFRSEKQKDEKPDIHESKSESDHPLAIQQEDFNFKRLEEVGLDKEKIESSFKGSMKIEDEDCIANWEFENCTLEQTTLSIKEGKYLILHAGTHYFPGLLLKDKSGVHCYNNETRDNALYIQIMGQKGDLEGAFAKLCYRSKPHLSKFVSNLRGISKEDYMALEEEHDEVLKHFSKQEHSFKRHTKTNPALVKQLKAAQKSLVSRQELCEATSSKPLTLRLEKQPIDTKEEISKVKNSPKD